jgi:Sulfotransferase family
MNTWRVLLEAMPHEVADKPTQESILAATRAAIDSAFACYLNSVGKSRWCDKSPDSCWDAELIARLYPQAKFICLYRHCMDVIASGVEARPWGLRQRVGLETDSFAAQYPGNSVAAGGAYWLAHSQKVMAFEDANPQRCHRVRYEDLVTMPEETAAGILSFLGVAPMPGITRDCFQVPHQGNNPGDKKIWFTSKVMTDSLGRGVKVPASWLPTRMRDDINQVMEKLDYRIIDNLWNEAVGVIDPRTRGEESSSAAVRPGPRDNPELDAPLSEISRRLTSWSREELRSIGDRWPFLGQRGVQFIVQGADGDHRALRWSVQVAREPIRTAADAGHGENASQGENGEARPISLIADPATWHALLAGAANVEAEKKAGRLRHLGKPASRDSGWDELQAAAALLGLSPVPLGHDASHT